MPPRELPVRDAAAPAPPTPWWEPTAAERRACRSPSRARRGAGPDRARLRPLAVVLAERRAAVPHPATPGPGVAEPARRVEPDLAAVAAAARPHAGRLLRTVAEVIAGRRPARHLAGVCADGVRTALLADLPGVPDRGARLGRIRVCPVSARAVELAAVVHGARARAATARLEQVEGDWRVTTLRLL